MIYFVKPKQHSSEYSATDIFKKYTDIKFDGDKDNVYLLMMTQTMKY